ncbi:MAG: methylated-DNA--[protein]-cysteine S-methyltransferase [Myxococcota bacterium]
MWFSWSEVGIVQVAFEAPSRRANSAALRERQLPKHLQKILDAYFAGETVDPTEFSVDLRGTDFQKRVWENLRSIPRGEVRSYGRVATDVGSPRGMRAVGMANAENPIPIVVPCHRVVRQGHRLGGYSGGLDRKRFLLALEGVLVEGDRVYPGQLVLPSPRRGGRKRKARE